MTVCLRQVALVAPALEPWASDLRTTFGLREPYRDPGISEFGLENVVFETGRSFLEIVAPVQEGTTAGRLLDKRGGAGGYMAIFQVDDLELARKRIDGLGVRVVWSAELEDMAGTHLHPKDVPGAIVSIDWASPHESWRWAGPRWTGTEPADARGGGVTAMTVAVEDPPGTARRWAEVLGVELDVGSNRIELGSGQAITFVLTNGARGEGIVDITIHGSALTPGEVTVGSVTVRAGGNLE